MDSGFVVMGKVACFYKAPLAHWRKFARAAFSLALRKMRKKSRNPMVRHKAYGWAAVLAVAAAYTAAYLWTLGTFRGETSVPPQDFGAMGASYPDHVELYLNILEIDPLLQEMSIRIIPKARGNLLAKDGVALSEELILDLEGARASFGSTLAEGGSEIIFPRNRVTAPLDATFMLEGGSVDSYPFDRYRVGVKMTLSKRDPTSPTGFSSVPLTVRLSPGVAGYRIDAEEIAHQGGEVGRDALPETRDDTVDLELNVRRSDTAFGFSLFLMAIVGALSFACAAVAISVTVGGRKVEPQFFTWMAGTLFAIVGLRGVLPGNPPLGALPDFLVFIWAESIVALSLLCIVFVHLRRRPERQGEDRRGA